MKILKNLMLFIAAIWGIVFVIIFPVMMLISHEEINIIPVYVSVAWIITAVIGFVVPCFLVRLKMYKVSTVLVLVGTVWMFILHSWVMENGMKGSIAWFYFPLLLETVFTIAIVRSEYFQKKREHDNAPAPSIIVDVESAKSTKSTAKKKEW